MAVPGDCVDDALGVDVTLGGVVAVAAIALLGAVDAVTVAGELAASKDDATVV